MQELSSLADHLSDTPREHEAVALLGEVGLSHITPGGRDRGAASDPVEAGPRLAWGGDQGFGFRAHQCQMREPKASY
jgi:hypothetical protein